MPWRLITGIGRGNEERWDNPGYSLYDPYGLRMGGFQTFSIMDAMQKAYYCCRYASSFINPNYCIGGGEGNPSFIPNFWGNYSYSMPSSNTTNTSNDSETSNDESSSVTSDEEDTSDVKQEVKPIGYDLVPWGKEEAVKESDMSFKLEGGENVTVAEREVDGEKEFRYTYTFEEGDLECKFTASTICDVEAIIQTFREAKDALRAAKAGETEEAKTKRETKNMKELKKIMDLKQEGGMLFVQSVMSEFVSVENQAKLTTEFLESGNPKVYEAVFKDENSFKAVMKNPENQKIVSKKLDEIYKKNAEDKTLSKDERQIQTLLDKYKNIEFECGTETIGGVSVELSGKIGDSGKLEYQDKNKTFSFTDKTIAGDFFSKLSSGDWSENDKPAMSEFFNCKDPALRKAIAKNLKHVGFTKDELIDMISKSEYIDALKNLDYTHLAPAEQEEVKNAVDNRSKQITSDKKLGALPDNVIELKAQRGVKLNAGSQIVADIDTSDWNVGIEVDDNVKQYKKTGQDPIYKAEVASDDTGNEIIFTSTSEEEAVQFANYITENKLTSTKDLDGENKSIVQEKNIKILQDRFKNYPTESVVEDIIATIKSENEWVDINAPETKALVKQLLETKEAWVIESLILEDPDADEGEKTLDEDFIKNDPNIGKVLAAIQGELAAKTEAGTELTEADTKLQTTLNLAQGKDLGGITFDNTGTMSTYAAQSADTNGDDKKADDDKKTDEDKKADGDKKDNGVKKNGNKPEVTTFANTSDANPVINACTIDDVEKLSKIFDANKDKKDITIAVKTKLTDLIKNNTDKIDFLKKSLEEFPITASVAIAINIKLDETKHKDILASVQKNLKPEYFNDLDDVKTIFKNGWKPAENANEGAKTIGGKIYGWMTCMLTDNDFEDFVNNAKPDGDDSTQLTTNSVVDVLTGYYGTYKDNEEHPGLIDRMRDDKMAAVACNKFIKALMRKALALGLENEEEFKNLAKFFNADYANIERKDGEDYVTQIFQGSEKDKLKITETYSIPQTGDSYELEISTVYHTEADAKALDTNLKGLYDKIMAWTGRDQMTTEDQKALAQRQQKFINEMLSKKTTF